jgi:hypothetical protein
VSFQVSVQEVGTHTVSVDGLSVVMNVTRPEARPYLYLLYALLTIVIILCILLVKQFR